VKELRTPVYFTGSVTFAMCCLHGVPEAERALDRAPIGS
jgi:hypothetical protein